jgi:hypothetical protein
MRLGETVSRHFRSKKVDIYEAIYQTTEQWSVSTLCCQPVVSTDQLELWEVAVGSGRYEVRTLTPAEGTLGYVSQRELNMWKFNSDSSLDTD